MTKNIKKGLEAVIEGISSLVSEETLNSATYQYLKNHEVEYLEKIDKIFFEFQFPFNNAVSELVHSSYPDSNHKGLLTDVLLNYSFFSSHLDKIMVKFYGSIFSHDRTRWVIQAILQWCKIGKEANIKLTYAEYYERIGDTERLNSLEEASRKKLCYWLPPTGSFEIWKNYVVGLHSLLYGDAEKYLIACQELSKNYEIENSQSS